MRDWLNKISRLPWPIVIAFDVAAFIAAAFSLALIWNVSSSFATSAPPVPDTGKRIAISFDDTPRGPGAFIKAGARPQLLLRQLNDAGVRQAVFFTNPGRVDPSNDFAAMMQDYARAGHVLANHTATHPRLSGTSAEQYLADIDKAEAWLKQQKGYRPWFRYPELDEGGTNAAKRDLVRAGLKARKIGDGYVTADAYDWALESLTIDAAKSGKKMDMKALRDLYVENHVEAANFADKLARRTFGKAAPQVLLLHDTDLAALYIGDLIDALRADGWTIISADEAYAKPLPETKKLRDVGGTRLQMLAREKGIKPPYWFDRSDRATMNRLFAERVLHQ